MKRRIHVIDFVNRSKSCWYKVNELEIQDAKQRYRKGEIISAGKKNYIVVEDYGKLRVTAPRYPYQHYHAING